MKKEMKKVLEATPDPWGNHLLGEESWLEKWSENLPEETRNFLRKRGVEGSSR